MTKTTRRPKPTKVAASRRNLFVELMEGFEELAQERQGKRTLRSHAVEPKPPVQMAPAEVLRVRNQLHLSRSLFAKCLRTNPRTLENWEQGRAKPNAQAALLIRLVQQRPDLVAVLAGV